MPTNAELATRVQAAEDVVADLLQALDDLREERVDLLSAVTQSLYLTRSQGAHNLAKELESKYGEVVERVGDQVTVTGTLHSASKGE